MPVVRRDLPCAQVYQRGAVTCGYHFRCSISVWQKLKTTGAREGDPLQSRPALVDEPLNCVGRGEIWNANCAGVDRGRGSRRFAGVVQ